MNVNGAFDVPGEGGPRRLTEDERRQIANLYRDDVSIVDIMRTMNVSRATVYYTLDALGVPRDRLPRAEVPDNVGDSAEHTLAWALRMVVVQQEEIGSLKAQLDACNEKLATVNQRLADLFAEGWKPPE